MAGIFSTYNADFAGFLTRVGTRGGDPQSLVAQNFLIDENVSTSRARSYEGETAVAPHADESTWRRAHQRYLSQRVFRPRPDGGRVISLDPRDEETCPETFQDLPPDSPYLYTDAALDLLRVEQVEFIASLGGVEPRELVRLAGEVVAARPGHDDGAAQLSDILAEWDAQCETRPVFAGYWEDLHDLFGSESNRDDRAADQRDWADALRDRLGLLHLDPGLRRGAPIDVIVFRYPAGAVPKLRGAEARPLVPPTVLDANQSAAFCPAPRGLSTGYTVDLSLSEPPCFREVLHPPVRFTARHVWRVGQVRRALSPGELPAARELHLECLREAAGRENYGAME